MTVSRRVELNRDLASALAPAKVLHEMCSHALDSAPEECCGLITGRDDDPYMEVNRITNVMTKMHLSDPVEFPRDAHHAYYMAETEYLRVQTEAEARGQVITAIYHSHCNAGAYLSDEDLIYAESPLFPFPGAAQIVLSVLGGRIKEAAIFKVDSEGSHYRGVQGQLLEAREE